MAGGCFPFRCHLEICHVCLVDSHNAVSVTSVNNIFMFMLPGSSVTRSSSSLSFACAESYRNKQTFEMLGNSEVGVKEITDKTQKRKI